MLNNNKLIIININNLIMNKLYKFKYYFIINYINIKVIVVILYWSFWSCEHHKKKDLIGHFGLCCESHFDLIFTCVASRHTLMALAGASRWQNMVQPLTVLTLVIFSISSCKIKRKRANRGGKRRERAKTAAAVPSLASRWRTDSAVWKNISWLSHLISMLRGASISPALQ